jgi:hypothetical protein
MPRPKSFLPQLSVDHALKAHDCQHNQCHRLHCGDARLKVKVQRTYEHFCTQCALEIINRDIGILTALAGQLNGC